MSYAKEMFSQSTGSNSDLIASCNFFSNPDKIISALGCRDVDPELLQTYKQNISSMSDDDISMLLPLLANSICCYKPEYKKVYDELKYQASKAEVVYRSDIDTLKEILVMVKDNWESLAIIAIFLRSLGKNKFSYEGESVFNSLVEIFKNIKD